MLLFRRVNYRDVSTHLEGEVLAQTIESKPPFSEWET